MASESGGRHVGIEERVHTDMDNDGMTCELGSYRIHTESGSGMSTNRSNENELVFTEE